MTQTPPDAPGSGTQHGGPRVSGEQMRDLGRLRRSITDRKVAGVAGGLGRHLDIDPTLLRVAFVVLIFFGGAGLLLYGAAWLLVPEDGHDEAAIETTPSTRNVVLLVAAVIAALLAIGDGWGAFGWGFWPLLVIGLVVALVLVYRDRSSGPPPPAAGPQSPGWTPPDTQDTSTSDPAAGAAATTPMQPIAPAAPWSPQPPEGPPTQTLPWQPPPKPDRGPSLFWPTIALVALALGGLGSYEAAGGSVVDSAYPALALAVIGLALVAGAWFGRTGGLGFIGVVAAVVLAVSSVVPDLSVGRFDRSPVTAAQLEDSYSMAAGRMHIDLSGIEDVESLDGRELNVDATAGLVIVTLPDDLDADVRVEIDGGGEAEIAGERRDGGDLEMQRRVDGGADAPELDLDINMLFGRAEVRS